MVLTPGDGSGGEQRGALVSTIPVEEEGAHPGRAVAAESDQGEAGREGEAPSRRAQAEQEASLSRGRGGGGGGSVGERFLCEFRQHGVRQGSSRVRWMGVSRRDEARVPVLQRPVSRHQGAVRDHVQAQPC